MTALPRVLIVDDSRMVRVSLVHHLKGHFDIREEMDGEAAWQALVLDPSIRAVVSDLQMPKMNGFQLLERLRSSKLRRLQLMPFILVSGEESDEEKARAVSLGVSDFIAKGTGSSEILARLNNLLALSQAKENLDVGREERVHDPVSGLFSRKYLELQAAQALSNAARHGIDIGVMVLGFDSFPGIRERLGPEVTDEVCNRFARMLAGKIRQEDSLGHFGPGVFAIVSPGTTTGYGAAFGERIRKSVEVAQLAVRGQNVALTVSVGLASIPSDVVSSAGALLDLADQRMKQAMAGGGNRIESGSLLPLPRAISLQHALELIKAGRSPQVVPHLNTLLEQLVPLLGLMNKELGLTLPMAEIEHHLGERKTEKK